MLKNQKGLVTVIGILIILIFIIMSAGLLPWVTNETRLATKNRDVLEAEYAAEAGVKRALVEFNKESPNWDWLHLDQPFINDSTTKKYNVTIYLASDTTTKTPITPEANSSNIYTIQSTGTVNGAVKTVSVSIASGGNPPVDPKVASDTAIYAGRLLEFKNNGTINKASIASGGNINGGVNVANPYAKYSNKSLEIPQYAVESFQGSPALPLPTNNEIKLTEGKYYVSGDWNPSHNSTISGDGIIFVNGNIIFPQNVNFTGKVHIIATGNMDASNSNNVSFNKAVLISYGDITAKNTFNATGSVVATGNITFKNGTNITYDLPTINSFGISTSNDGKIQKGSWKIN